MVEGVVYIELYRVSLSVGGTKVDFGRKWSSGSMRVELIQ